jgi:alpha-galactosidase
MKQGSPARLSLTLFGSAQDYLKYDNCGSEGISQQAQMLRHAAMRDALVQAKHPIFFALCEWNGHVGDPFQWVNSTGNSWRTNGDIDPQWESVLHVICLHVHS